MMCNQLALFLMYMQELADVYLLNVGKSAGLVIERFASSNPGRSGVNIFFSRINFVYLLLNGVRSTPVLPQ